MAKIRQSKNGREDEIYTHKYAAKSYNSKGRERDLGTHEWRTEYQRDTHRISYSQPFRRMRNKTQVFYLPDNDHICTRLEHALHVSSAARTVARALGLNEDLAEAIGLGHDLGHAPFGHHGESILHDICKKESIRPAFHHEVNSLRVVDRLAQLDREETPGLALMYEVRDGIVSHNGEDFTQPKLVPFEGKKNLGNIKLKADAKNPLTLEGCIVHIVDKVAYGGRDLEDGIQAELIKENQIPPDIKTTLGANNGAIVGTLISDIIENTPLHEKYIAMSDEKFEALNKLIKFNHENIYENEKVQRYKNQAGTSLRKLFEIFLETVNKTERFSNETELSRLPDLDVYKVFEKFIKDLKYDERDTDGEIVIDFMSGFTDNYVLRVLDDVFVPKAIV